MTDTQPTLSERLAPLAAEKATIDEQVAALTERRDTIVQAIRDLVATSGPGTYGAGDREVVVQLNRRLDLAKLAADHPVESNPELYKLTPDTKLVRANLAPADVDRYMVPAGLDKVTVK